MSVVLEGRSIVNSNGFVDLFAWSKGQMGGSVANSNVFVVSKKRSVVNSRVFHALAWSKGGNAVNSCVFVCFCMAEGRTCRKVSCFCVFLLGRNGEMSKSVVFLCVFWVKSKSVVFLYVLGFLCVFARSKGGNVEKCRVCRKCLVFVCFLGEAGRWGSEPSAQPIV